MGDAQALPAPSLCPAALFLPVCFCLASPGPSACFQQLLLPSPSGLYSFPLFLLVLDPCFVIFNEKRDETGPVILTAPFQTQGTRYTTL